MTFFIAYARCPEGVDMSGIPLTATAEEYLSFDEINRYIEEHVRRKIVIVGGCTGSDAHTVGIDAIMNMKGYNHHFGLERYPMFETHNMGSQVSNMEIIEYSLKVKADAILVSQIVTQNDIHLRNLKDFVKLLEKRNVRNRFIIIAGGPQINHKLAADLGFDGGFGRGTYAEHVGTFVARKLAERG
jgi:beta-lysine 5,6-aminomutase beta subunit